jgi:hypothetical protein
MFLSSNVVSNYKLTPKYGETPLHIFTWCRESNTSILLQESRKLPVFIYIKKTLPLFYSLNFYLLSEMKFFASLGYTHENVTSEAAIGMENTYLYR